MQNINFENPELIGGDTRWNYLRGFADVRSFMRATRFTTAGRMHRYIGVPPLAAKEVASEYGLSLQSEAGASLPVPQGTSDRVNFPLSNAEPEPKRRRLRANAAASGRTFTFIDVVRHSDVRLRLSPGEAVDLPRIYVNPFGRIVFSGEKDLQDVRPSEFTDAWCRAMDRRIESGRYFSVLDGSGLRAEGFRRARDALLDSWSLSALVPPFRLEVQKNIGRRDSTEDENILHFRRLFQGLAEMRLALMLKSILDERSEEGRDDPLAATREAVRWAFSGEISSSSLAVKAQREWRFEKGVYLRGSGREGLMVADAGDGWIMRATQFSARGNPMPLPNIWIRDPLITAFAAEFLDKNAAFDIEDEACTEALQSAAEELQGTWQWRSKSAMAVAQAAAKLLGERWRFERVDIELAAEWFGENFASLIPPSEGGS